MSNITTVRVPHLGGIDAAYQTSSTYDAAKPTVVLVNSFTTSAELYQSQFANKELTESVNLIAIELLGHGQTRTASQQFTYWDTAIMNLQVLEALNMSGPGKKVFVLGTSQGGWICVRMALLAPDLITGIMPLGTSMDHESERTRALGCWNAPEGLTPVINALTSMSAMPDFEPDDAYCDFTVNTGFGTVDDATRQFWHKTIKVNYRGDDGRRRMRMAAINLRDRDGLHGRLFDVRCPVLWMHGTADKVYSVANAKEEIKLFVNSPDARLRVVEGGAHFLSFSHPREVDAALLEFVTKYGF